MDLFIALMTATCSVLAVFLGGLYAYQDRFLTVGQMESRGISRGLPFLGHMGMYGDVLLITPIITYVVFKWSYQWHIKNCWMSLVGGCAVSLLMHGIDSSMDFPESHWKQVKGRPTLTKTGWTHYWYMAFASAIMVQFYLHTDGVPASTVIMISCLLATHMFWGTHIPLGLWNPKWYKRGNNYVAWVIFFTSCLCLTLLAYLMIYRRS